MNGTTVGHPRRDPPTIDGDCVDLTATPASPFLGYVALVVLILLIVPPFAIVVWCNPGALALYLPAAALVLVLAKDM